MSQVVSADGKSRSIFFLLFQVVVASRKKWRNIDSLACVRCGQRLLTHDDDDDDDKRISASIVDAFLRPMQTTTKKGCPKTCRRRRVFRDRESVYGPLPLGVIRGRLNLTLIAFSLFFYGVTFFFFFYNRLLGFFSPQRVCVVSFSRH